MPKPPNIQTDRGPAAGVFTIDEAAAYFRISRASLYRLIGRGELKRIQIGGRSLIRRADADTFLSRCAGEVA
ncbi:hypothetical protein DK419_15445 [Methylobacterium terrae]|uniref:Helix-turn-helix domain-containing protein n=1 Tax=Methylobacterium terrae TaxID=2202827 RepID=A0A2U8WMZ4_9HYPH|nr:helix-turn-helix domain-containing protein [Methylobacterium terrae]AWN47529.1 hypothetical protein DK419_15445 [Methylobacterium terrae]